MLYPKHQPFTYTCSSLFSYILIQPEELTERQKLRQEIKAKKSLPKLSAEDRRQKYVGDVDANREKEREQFVVCLGCRKRGHSLKNCPNAMEKMICFNCNSTGQF